MAKFTKIQLKRLDEVASRIPLAKPFKNNTPAEKTKRIASVSQSNWKGFSSFCYLYLGHIFTLKFNQDHREMFEYAQKSYRGMVVNTGYRGLGKTAEMGIAYVIWRLTTQGDQYNIQVASDEKKAEKRSSWIHNELSTNPRILEDFPRCKPTGDDFSSFYLADNSLIETKSIRQDCRGSINPRTAKRPDIIVYDDIDSSQNIGNQSIGKKRADQIKGDGIGALAPSGGRVIVLGNEVHPNYAISVLAFELDPQKKTGHIVKGDRVFLRFDIEDKNGNSRWPEQYSNDTLAKIREDMGYVSYLREMRGQPIIEGNYFKYDWFKFWEVLPKKFNKMWLYADPSWGEKGCFKAIAVISMAGDDRFYLVDFWAEQCSNPKFYQIFIDMFFRYRKKGCKAAFETVYGQKKHLSDMDIYCKQNGYPVISHLIKRINNKQNKNARIENLDTVIEYGKLLFCRNPYINVLTSQLCSYPQGYDDGPDALAGAMERFTEYKKKGNVRVKQLNH